MVKRRKVVVDPDWRCIGRITTSMVVILQIMAAVWATFGFPKRLSYSPMGAVIGLAIEVPVGLLLLVTFINWFNIPSSKKRSLA